MMVKESPNLSSGQNRTLMKSYAQRHLSSQSVEPSNVAHAQIVVGGDHGDMAFQSVASVFVLLHDESRIDFEVSVCELICRKDTGRLLKETILPRLTQGLEVIATFQLHVFIHHKTGNLVVEFRRHCPNQDNAPGSPSTHTPISKVFVTGNLAFQAMALGKESMAGHWCMQCKAMRLQFTEDCELWTMGQLVGRSDDAITNNPVLGVKQKPWWPFIPLQNYVVPLLHCEIGVGNQS